MREAAGFFLYRQTANPGEREFLALRNARHGSWGVPKGHRSTRDTDLRATAFRELEEETGLTQVEVVKGFEVTIQYTVQRDSISEPYEKSVTYYLASCASDAGVRRSAEHSEFLWLSGPDMLKQLSYESLRGAFRKAMEFLERMDGKVQAAEPKV